MLWRYLHKKYNEHVPCSYAYKVVCIDDIFSKPIFVYKGENAAYKSIKAILEERKYCKKILRDEFNKNLFMTEEEEHLFQQSNNCWICKKLIDNKDERLEIIVIWLGNLGVVLIRIAILSFN